jgi:hypothetical protein
MAKKPQAKKTRKTKSAKPKKSARPKARAKKTVRKPAKKKVVKKTARKPAKKAPKKMMLQKAATAIPITIDTTKNPPTVVEEHVYLKKGKQHTAVWSAILRPNDLLQIEFDAVADKKGPFDWNDDDPQNPAEGVYEATGSGNQMIPVQIYSNRVAHPVSEGTQWKYTVRLLDKVTRRALGTPLDPFIHIDH